MDLYRRDGRVRQYKDDSQNSQSLHDRMGIRIDQNREIRRC